MLTIYLALAALLVTQALRTFDFLGSWRERKPLACDLCMSVWTTLAVAGVAKLDRLPVDWLNWFAAGGLCYVLLRLLPPPARLP